MIAAVDEFNGVAYENWNTISYEQSRNIAKRKLRKIYATDKLGWCHGRIEFLETIIKRELGDDYFDKHCKEIY